jgi:hypothetical protein
MRDIIDPFRTWIYPKPTHVDSCQNPACNGWRLLYLEAFQKGDGDVVGSTEW